MAPLKKKEMRAGLSSVEGSIIGSRLKDSDKKRVPNLYASYKCCVQVPARIIGKDPTNLNRSHHSSSSVKAVSRGAALT